MKTDSPASQGVWPQIHFHTGPSFGSEPFYLVPPPLIVLNMKRKLRECSIICVCLHVNTPWSWGLRQEEDLFCCSLCPRGDLAERGLNQRDGQESESSQNLEKFCLRQTIRQAKLIAECTIIVPMWQLKKKKKIGMKTSPYREMCICESVTHMTDDLLLIVGSNFVKTNSLVLLPVPMVISLMKMRINFLWGETWQRIWSVSLFYFSVHLFVSTNKLRKYLMPTGKENSSLRSYQRVLCFSVGFWPIPVNENWK